MDEVEPKQNPINSYTLPPSIEQITLLIYFFTLLILHSIFIASAIPIINSPILYVILVLMYILLIGLLKDYCHITRSDPVDSIVAARSVNQEQKGVAFCYRCSTYRSNHSHHCGTCDRCTGQFDHHCTYLNNCIGGINYKWFIRLLLMALGYSICLIAQGVWIFVAALNDSNVDSRILSKWAIIVIIAVLVPGMIVVMLLLAFHLYITFNKKMTTFEFLMARRREQQQKIQENKKKETKATKQIDQQDRRENRLRFEIESKQKVATMNIISPFMTSEANLIKSEMKDDRENQIRFEDIPQEPQVRNVYGQQLTRTGNEPNKPNKLK